MNANKSFVLLLLMLFGSAVCASDAEKQRELRLAAGIGDVETIDRLLDEIGRASCRERV